MTIRIKVEAVAKEFTLHAQGGVRLPVMSDASMEARGGECTALIGESGAGKSTLMRMIYGNYRTQAGRILIEHQGRSVDMASAEPHEVLEVRRLTLGYVTQFLRVIPRVPTLDVVAEPLLAVGTDIEAARERARALLTRLRVREALWPLSPLTFSGGEQQRVNIARGFAHEYPCLLLDEPTASLDAVNKETVVTMIEEAKARGVAVIGIFHDASVRERICEHQIDVTRFAPQSGAAA
ncbi:MAG: phosphonate C-P lyase system protein PhnL [Neomegalonema sp.]|nr:phosphonate C-P lyase system protein PhnL [Neomegalonema sp.]